MVSTIDGAETALPVDGLFVAIGSNPRTHLVHGQLALTADGSGTVAALDAEHYLSTQMASV